MDVIQQPPYIQGCHQKGWKLKRKGIHKQMETQLYHSYTAFPPKCHKERPFISENALPPPPTHCHEHMQKLGRQSCISYLPPLLDFGTLGLERNEAGQQTPTEPHLPKVDREWVVVRVKGAGKANHSHSTPHGYLPPNTDRTRAFPITGG